MRSVARQRHDTGLVREKMTVRQRLLKSRFSQRRSSTSTWAYMQVGEKGASVPPWRTGRGVVWNGVEWSEVEREKRTEPCHGSSHTDGAVVRLVCGWPVVRSPAR